MKGLSLGPRKENRLPNRWDIRELRNLEKIETTWDEQLSGLKYSFENLLKSAHEQDYVLRSQIAFLFSLFDFILHEIVKFGLVNMFAGQWNKTNNYMKLVLSMEDFEKGKLELFSETWFLSVQDQKFSTSSLCGYDKMCEHFGLMGISKKEVADKAFYVQGSKVKTEEQFRETIYQLNKLRNPIVHQASLDVRTLDVIPITEDQVLYLMNNLNKIVHAILEVIRIKIANEE